MTLKHLHIQNIILIEHAALSFQPGFNILTGETGSGKSALMHSLSLAIGERTDTSLIRRGCDKGVIEAVFETNHPNIAQMLIEGGFDYEEGQELIVRREISLTGKGKIFINHQLAQVSFLRKLCSHLVQIVGQHANQSLLSLDYHREMVDLFGDLHPLLTLYQQNYDNEKKLRNQLDELIRQESHRLREIAICQTVLEELETAQIKEGEEEELFAEYTLLSNSEEISQKIFEMNQALSGERNPLLSLLNRQKQSLESLIGFDPSLQEPAQAFQNAYLELQEISHFLHSYQNGLNFDPERLKVINERLTLLNQLKKKYGSSVADILAYQSETAAKLKKLENGDFEIEEIRGFLNKVETSTEQLSQELSLKRREWGERFEKSLTAHLRTLNMSKAVFTIEITEQSRTREGSDRIEFFLSPNTGEHKIPLREGVSGGEMSRILLALQTLLAGKEQRETLIFDEVDANIGGETATIIGDKLREISQQHQVICITHFPQVAIQAHHHFQISKEEKEGRTLTLVQELDQDSRQLELARMAGQKLDFHN